MKKIFTLILAGIMACSISACGGSSETNSDVNSPASEEKTQSIDEKKTESQTSADKEVETEEKEDK